MNTECNKVLKIGINKQFWIDANKSDNLTCKVYYIDNTFSIKEQFFIKLTYLQNNLWRGEITSPAFPCIVLGEVNSKNIKTYFTVNYEMLGSFLYHSRQINNSSQKEWLQINENGEVIDYGNLTKITNEFYGGTLNKKIPSLICIENICVLFKKQLTTDCSDAKTAKELRNCLEQNNNIMQKYILLEKKLKECLSDNNIHITPPMENIYKNSISSTIKRSKDKTETSPMPTINTTKNITSSIKESTNISSNVVSQVKINTTSNNTINSELN